MTQTPMPDLQQATLDPVTLRQLFEDLVACATILEVTLKAGPQHHARASTATIEEALALLEHGLVRGVQVRYLHEGQCWWDTLIWTPNGVRLTRIAAPELAATTHP